MKKCEHCGLSHTHLGAPIEFPDADSRYCVACLARNPQLSRATCVQCGSWRKLTSFPGGDATQPCNHCLSKRKERATCGGCGSTRNLARFPGRDPSRDCLVCDPSAARKPSPDVPVALDLLRNAGLAPGGPVRTVKELLALLGLPGASMLARRAGGDWLREQGFEMRAVNGKQGFRLEPGAPSSPMFKLWADRFGCADALGLPADELQRYMGGALPPQPVRLAMSALTAGLPAWS